MWPLALIVPIAVILTGFSFPNLLMFGVGPVKLIVVLAVLAINVKAIVDLFGQPLTLRSRLPWTFLILFWPGLGLILYCLIVRRGE